MKLLEPTQLRSYTLQNKMVMAAMTRSRADINGVVGDLTTLYYTQRASAGLIITEGINISEQGIGSPLTPGLYTHEQIEAWKKVTKSVHHKGGVIFAQLWHTGRVGHSAVKNGALPVAPSAIAINGMQHFTLEGMKDYETPQELTIAEIKQIIKDYGQAARNAIEAGFDGVQLHGANGYLPHQFLAENANQRTDEYGGSIENMSRFVLEVMQELIHAVGGDKVGIKISPLNPYAGIVHTDPVATYTYLIRELNKLDFAFVELMRRNRMFALLPHYPKDDEIELFGKLVKQTLVAGTAYNKETAETELNKGIAKLIAFGATFLANPDLPKRFELDAALNQPDRGTMFGGGKHGYTDYPFLNSYSLNTTSS
jgi:NADH:flavin oxidoreductases, Old Yellow Enzyme family